MRRADRVTALEERRAVEREHRDEAGRVPRVGAEQRASEPQAQQLRELPRRLEGGVEPEERAALGQAREQRVARGQERRGGGGQQERGGGQQRERQPHRVGREGEPEEDRGADEIAPDEEATTVRAVDPRAGEGSEEEDWHGREEDDPPRGRGRARERGREPRDGADEDRVPHLGDELARPQEDRVAPEPVDGRASCARARAHVTTVTAGNGASGDDAGGAPRKERVRHVHSALPARGSPSSGTMRARPRSPRPGPTEKARHPCVDS
jgi:hypothetical protein